MIYPENFTDIIGFSTITNRIASYCTTKQAAKKASNLKPYSKSAFILKQWDLLDEWNEATQSYKHPIPDFDTLDFSEFIHKLKVENMFLQEFELFVLWKSVEFFMDFMSFIEQNSHLKALNTLALRDTELSTIPKLIAKTLSPKGEILPNASSSYAKLIGTINQQENNLREQVQRIYLSWKKLGYTSDLGITVREDKLVVPIIAEFKRKIKGYVVDVSSTGSLFFVQPAETLELNNILKENKIALERERIKILTTLSNALRPNYSALLNLNSMFVKLDLLQAKYKICKQIQAQRPQLSVKPILNLKQAQNPLLWWDAKSPNGIVSFNIELTENQQIVLISGPNAGGKSVVLSTTLLCAFMAQCGLFIPAQPNSTVGMFSNFFSESGDGQTIENGLSTFSAHLNALNYMLVNSNKNTLFGIDEISNATDPVYAVPIAQSVLETLIKNGAKGLVTTHFGKLKQWAHKQTEITNAGMEYDTTLLEPLFKLRMHIPGQSYAMELMKKSGFHLNTQNRALQLADKQQIKEDKLISDLEQKEQEWNIVLAQNNKKSAELLKLMQEYEQLKDNLYAEKAKILANAETEAKLAVSIINKKIESTIKQIVESNAAKEITKIKRIELKETATEQLVKLEKKPVLVKVEPEPVKKVKLQIGDLVKNSDSEAKGEIVEIKKDKALVAFGIVNIWLKISDLLAAKADNKQKIAVSFISAHDRFNPKLDIIGQAASEALVKLENWLQEAYKLGIKELKVIHGHGSGVLRTTMRDALKSKSFVKSYNPEKVGSGGEGATIVHLF